MSEHIRAFFSLAKDLCPGIPWLYRLIGMTGFLPGVVFLKV
jgi:hypothetical protein